MKITGYPAFMAWAFIHVLYLVGWGHRIGTVYQWAWSLVLTKNRGQRLITVEDAYAEIEHRTPREEARPERPFAVGTTP